MRLYVVRHAIAEERDPDQWPDDSRRPLTDEGRSKFQDAARGLNRMVGSVDTVISSPYTRAEQTARILERIAGWPAAEIRDELVPGGDPVTTAAMLRTRDEQRIAVVGHEPDLSSLVSYLLTGTPGAVEVVMKKGAAVALSGSRDAPPGMWMLDWMMPPRALRRIAN